MLTIIGFSMNDTIVVFDRIRENAAPLRDQKFDRVVNHSINETLSRTILTCATVFFVTLAMNIFGTGVIRDFAFAMNVGVIVGTYSSIFIAAPILIWLNEKYSPARSASSPPGSRPAPPEARGPSSPAKPRPTKLERSLAPAKRLPNGSGAGYLAPCRNCDGARWKLTRRVAPHWPAGAAGPAADGADPGRRGLGDRRGAARFLEPRLADLRQPEGIADLDRALDRLTAALAARESASAVFGDYDVDGVTTAAILTTCSAALGRRGGPARGQPQLGLRRCRRPRPRRFADEGCRVVVTGDCGTSDHEALARVPASAGSTSIVIDHHQVPSGATAAFALINPHRADDRFPFKGLASCGVAFYLAAALRTRLARRQARPPSIRAMLLDLVALGTRGRPGAAASTRTGSWSPPGCASWRRAQRPGLRALATLAELGEHGPPRHRSTSASA